ncbi:MAG: tetratricopeptide repeat protein, partial [Endomicrobiaceae bacterium]|nr:tetratricopeptide repeat protein [Endomicrobiaceae bacterium]
MQKILNQAYQYQNTGQYEKAIELFEKLKQHKEYYEISIFEIAKSYKMQNNPVKAIEYFIELIKFNNNYKDAIKELSQTACLSKNYEQAENLLKSLADKTNDIIFYIELIKIFFDKNDIQMAEMYIQKINNIDSENTEIKLLQAKLKRSQGYLTKSIEIFNELLNVVDDKEDIYIELAEIYFLKGEYIKAIDYFEKIAGNKKDKYIYLKLVELYYLTEQNEKSDAAGKKALELTPQNQFDQDTILNEIEILQRKIILKSKMKRLWVTVTSRCNIRCKTCG